ncbi:GGDEF domain-containing protein [Vibrio anguillarum]|uniref:GGDEF domain-containing protein n=1 Tax=Vibrio anguillarum TaxID=55601 RepID=UPI0018FE4BE9|nr:GGDEF domain-containing protein [Vibrio anguillarum]MBF4424423.1 GGDEF domain-containing protein [Vibrio anguillarum]
MMLSSHYNNINVMVRAFRLIGLLWLATAAHSVTSAPIINAKTYRVATEADDVVTRILFDAIAYQFRLEIDYVNYPSFDAILTAIEQGESDFAANVTYTEQRAQRFDFSSPTNIEYTYAFSHSNVQLTDLARVGVPKGTIYGELIAAYFPHIIQVEYDGARRAKELLSTAEVDVVVDAINQLKPMLMAGLDAQLLNDQLPIQPVAIITPKGHNTLLLNKIQEYVHSASVQKLLRKSVQKYQFDIRKQALRQSVIDSGLNVQRPLKVKLENINQFAQYQHDGKVKGINADIVFKACDILLLKCELASQPDETWESMYADLVNKRIDILVPVTVSQQRKSDVYFSDTYYQPEAVLIKRENYKDNVYSNVSELIVERIGVIKEDFFEELLGKMLPNKVLHVYKTQNELVKALLGKEVDYIVLNRANFNQILREADNLLPLEEDLFIGSFYSSEIAMGFPKNSMGASLAPLFTRAIKMIDTQKIINTYDYQPNWRATLAAEKTFSRHTQWLFTLVFGFLLVVAFYLHSQSVTDNLTKLRNRRALYRRYSRGLNSDLTLIYLDVNNFKPINDNYGHEVGDEVLKALASRIDSIWRGRSYRIGGDEFILIGQYSDEELEPVLMQLESFTYSDSARNLNIKVNVAIGVSNYRDHFMSLEEVLHQTDIAMYQSKHHGSGQRDNTKPLLKIIRSSNKS